MALTESQVTALELERVIPKIRTLFERDDKFYANIKKREVEKISNRQMRIPLEIRPGGAFQYFNANGGDLGRGGGPTFDKAVLTSVFMSENIEYTKLAQWATDDSRKAIVSTVRRLTATAFDEMRRQLDAQMMQDGSGVIGTVGAGSTTSSLVLNVDGFGARLMRFGQTIQVFNSSGPALRGSAVITGWDVVAKTVTIDPAIAGTTTNDLVVVNGITTPTFAAAQALFGVPYHHNSSSSGTWLGFDRSTTPEIRANRINASSNPLTLPLPRLAINAIGNRVGIDNNFNPNAWTHPAQKQAYEQIGQLVSFIQKQPKEEGLDMYFERMSMAGASVKISFNWNPSRIDFVTDEVWGRAEILPLGFYTTDGRKIFELRGASGGVATADIFYLVIGMQTFVTNPAACAYISDLSVPSGY
jgi:hypothetical protein